MNNQFHLIYFIVTVQGLEKEVTLQCRKCILFTPVNGLGIELNDDSGENTFYFVLDNVYFSFAQSAFIEEWTIDLIDEIRANVAVASDFILSEKIKELESFGFRRI